MLIRNKCRLNSTLNFKRPIKLLAAFLGLNLGMTMLTLADTPKTHDAPMYHNKDGFLHYLNKTYNNIVGPNSQVRR